MIRKMKKTIGDSDPPDYITLLDMTVNLWNVQDLASLEANAGVNISVAIPLGCTFNGAHPRVHIQGSTSKGAHPSHQMLISSKFVMLLLHLKRCTTCSS